MTGPCEAESPGTRLQPGGHQRGPRTPWTFCAVLPGGFIRETKPPYPCTMSAEQETKCDKPKRPGGHARTVPKSYTNAGPNARERVVQWGTPAEGINQKWYYASNALCQRTPGTYHEFSLPRPNLPSTSPTYNGQQRRGASGYSTRRSRQQRAKSTAKNHRGCGGGGRMSAVSDFNIDQPLDDSFRTAREDPLQGAGSSPEQEPLRDLPVPERRYNQAPLSPDVNDTYEAAAFRHAQVAPPLSAPTSLFTSPPSYPSSEAFPAFDTRGAYQSRRKPRLRSASVRRVPRQQRSPPLLWFCGVGTSPPRARRPRHTS
ncbi:hypothetical protein OH77DRAFT_1262400 [Trametes cingulata]|nr:hypothetical protein OH77DRAFT_1262400 [Trametes cingulata]